MTDSHLQISLTEAFNLIRTLAIIYFADKIHIYKQLFFLHSFYRRECFRVPQGF